MWVTHDLITGEEEKNEDISRCWMFFRLFGIDIDVLFSEGIIKRIAFDRYEWTESKTSLAEYFHWIGVNESYIEGGFWAPVAKSFIFKNKPITQSQLSNLLYKQQKTKLDSPGFKKIKDTVTKYRAELKKQEEEAEEWKVFHKNFEEWLNEKHRIIHEYFELPIHERETPETIRNVFMCFDEADKVLKSGEKIT